MKASTAIAIASATLAASSPVSLVKREVGGVLLCTGANATGSCEYQAPPLGTCKNLTAPYVGNVLTFAPSGEDFFCRPQGTPCGGICTSPHGCYPKDFTFDTPEKYDLGAIGWAKGVFSFQCFKSTE